MKADYRKLVADMEGAMIENFKTDGSLQGYVFLIPKTKGMEPIIFAMPEDRQARAALPYVVRSGTFGPIHAVIVIMECWTLSLPIEGKLEGTVSEHPDREEGVMLSYDDEDGNHLTVRYKIERPSGELVDRTTLEEPAAGGSLSNWFPPKKKDN